MRAALEASPSLLAARAEADAARARLSGASLLLQSNPEVEGAVGPRRPEGGGERSIDVNVGVSQRVEVFGQRGARKDAARAQLQSAEALLQARRVDLAAEVREAFARGLAAQQEAQLAQDGLALANASLGAARQRQASGAASRIEVNTAQVEAGRAAREAARARQREAQALGTLRLLVGLSPEEALQLEPPGAAAPGAPAPALEALVARALEARADVTAARADVEAARAEARLAAREALPSPSLGVAYGREEGAQIIQGTLGFALPVFNANRAARGVAGVRQVQAEATLAALTRQVRQEVVLAHARLAQARSGAEASGGEVVAALEENLALVQEAYRAGKVDFLQLLVIRREALDARLGVIEALEELAAAEAQLKRSLGSVE